MGLRRRFSGDLRPFVTKRGAQGVLQFGQFGFGSHCARAGLSGTLALVLGFSILLDDTAHQLGRNGFDADAQLEPAILKTDLAGF